MFDNSDLMNNGLSKKEVEKFIENLENRATFQDSYRIGKSPENLEYQYRSGMKFAYEQISRQLIEKLRAKHKKIVNV